MLFRKFVKCSPDVNCYLFKAYCCNLYCAPFWYDSTQTAMKNLKVAYNNSLRRLLALQDTRYKIQDTRYFISGTKPIVKTY